MGRTLVEIIAARFADGLKSGGVVRSGDFVTIRPKHVMTHDNTGAVIPKFKQIGATRIHDPRQPVFAIDHDIQNKSPENLGKYAKIEKFANDNGIDFYIVLVLNLTHDLLDQVLHGHHALDAAVFVHDDSHVGLRVLQHPNRIVHLCRIGDEHRLSQQL